MAAPGLPGTTVDARTQEKTWELLQKMMAEHWNGEAADNGTTNKAGNETNVEAAFRAAAQLMPERLDLRLGIASSLIGQAAGTNGQRLELKVREALAVYREILALDTNSFEAPLLFCAYSRVIGHTNASAAVLQEVEATHPARTAEYVQRFEKIDQLLQTVPETDPKRSYVTEQNYAIVVLGAGLETNGTLKPKLVSRLKQCLKLARRHRRAPIILTGGNAKAGITEAYAMQQWCLKKGISKSRLWLEDKARDTVENALYTSVILKKLGARQATLVTSLSHMRRGLADLEEACRQGGLEIEWFNLAAKTKGEKELDPEQERLGIYRDVLRTSGLWAYPGLRR